MLQGVDRASVGWWEEGCRVCGLEPATVAAIAGGADWLPWRMQLLYVA